MVGVWICGVRVLGGVSGGFDLIAKLEGFAEKNLVPVVESGVGAHRICGGEAADGGGERN